VTAVAIFNKQFMGGKMDFVHPLSTGAVSHDSSLVPRTVPGALQMIEADSCAGSMQKGRKCKSLLSNSVFYCFHSLI
jgi:hypothetical protein